MNNYLGTYGEMILGIGKVGKVRGQKSEHTSHFTPKLSNFARNKKKSTIYIKMNKKRYL